LASRITDRALVLRFYTFVVITNPLVIWRIASPAAIGYNPDVAAWAKRMRRGRLLP
jgi:hypothetical protein